MLGENSSTGASRTLESSVGNSVAPAIGLYPQGYPQGWPQQPQISTFENVETPINNDKDELALIIYTQNNEPNSYNQAIKSEDLNKWQEAMKLEIKSLKS